MGPPTTSTPEIAGAAGGREGQPGVARLFELTSELLATISLDGRFTLLNPAWEQLLGWTREELLAAPIQHFMHPDDVEQTLALMRSGVPEGAAQTFTNRYRHRDGSWRWLLWSARRDGDTWYAAAKDVTDRRWLERQALHDPLTHLPNRLLLMDRARQALARLHRSHGVVAMMFIDLDKFKAVNDTRGHAAGDQLLATVANRLRTSVRASDTVARLGGDEFVILAGELDRIDDAAMVAEKVSDMVGLPVPLEGGPWGITCSIGIAIFPRDAETAVELLALADKAMYAIKGRSGDRARFYSPA